MTRNQIETISSAAIVLQSRAREGQAYAALAKRRSATALLNRVVRGALGRLRATSMLVLREQRRIRALREKEMLLLSQVIRFFAPALITDAPHLNTSWSSLCLDKLTDDGELPVACR
jgi:hypothetical protein